MLRSRSQALRRAPLNLALASVLLLPGSFLFTSSPSALAQDASHANNIDTTWQGTLHLPENHNLRTVLKVSKDATGKLTAQFFSIDQNPTPINVTSISFEGGVFKFAIKPFDLSYEGKMSPDGATITGTSTQGDHALPLNLDRTTPSTAWEIPAPPPPIKPMPSTADPSFDVATVKPSKPDQPGKMFRVEGRHFSTMNTTLADIIEFAYGLHPKQIVNAPDWISTEKYDLSGNPDIDGMPSDRQLKGMVQKLLADRFQLKFHKDTRELSCYTLTTAKSGPKLDKSDGDADSLPGLWFQQLGNLNVHNATMADFTGLMQSAVLDRPVIDQTNLPGRWNFNLKWTPDETQFAGMGVKVTPPTDAANAPPPLFTAIQEEIGLKLDATKTQVPVIVVDRLEKPSDN